MPGLVPGIHGVPLQRTSLLNSRLFPQPVRGERACPGLDPGEAPRRDCAGEGEVGSAANSLTGPPHPSLSPAGRGERDTKLALEGKFGGKRNARFFRSGHNDVSR
jgi:hypothetical protein